VVLAEIIHGDLEGAEGAAQLARNGRVRLVDAGESVADDTRIDASEEERGAETEVREPVSVCRGYALDETVQSEAPEVVGHPARGDVAELEAQQRSEVLA
jgi:hypothetical protein